MQNRRDTRSIVGPLVLFLAASCSPDNTAMNEDEENGDLSNTDAPNPEDGNDTEDSDSKKNLPIHILTA